MAKPFSIELIRQWDSDQTVFMWAFDLIELDGADTRREPLTQRKALLERALARAAPGLRFNEHLDEEDGPLVFHHACKLGLEGIVSKRRDSPYSSGRSRHWIEAQEPQLGADSMTAPTVTCTREQIIRNARTDGSGDFCCGARSIGRSGLGEKPSNWPVRSTNQCRSSWQNESLWTYIRAHTFQ
jgi:ATP dependent DNA ligase domain